MNEKKVNSTWKVELDNGIRINKSRKKISKLETIHTF